MTSKIMGPASSGISGPLHSTASILSNETEADFIFKLVRNGYSVKITVFSEIVLLSLM